MQYGMEIMKEIGIHPAVIRAMQQVVDAAHAAGKPVSVCGEMAADPLGAMALIGLGFRSISMAPAAIGPVKTMILSLEYSRVKGFIEERLEPDRTGNLRDDLRRFAELNSIEI